MKGLLALLGISALIAIAHTMWKNKQKKKETISDKPLNDSSDSSNDLEVFDDNDSNEG